MTQELPNARDFLLKTPLYLAFEYSEGKVWDVLNVLYFGGTYDNYCVKCRRESTFQVVPQKRPDEYVRNEQRERMIVHATGKIPYPKIPLALHTVHAVCTRENSHTQDFVFLTENVVHYDDSNNPRFSGVHPCFHGHLREGRFRP